ncbi:hydroperoxide isomerase ALOXE3-like [Nerophis ophidion]|uniref:hydroperoxide isomerase ALOXE3-like n=1 Tax=Nerophis ophidion TaxID=159077 RepID=UPI002ADFD9D7|nr:hydroperoxide isomerase ALOXE3-like [Nerophis ophidion]
MVEYKFDATTGEQVGAGTWDHILITLFGTEGQSETMELNNWGVDFITGTTGTYTVKTSASLGKLLLVKVEKDPKFLLPDDDWYCSKIVVTTPEREVLLFPCYQWLSNKEVVELRGGRAMKVFEDDHPLLIEHRKKELASKKNLFRWAVFKEGLPYHADFNATNVPAETRMSVSRMVQSKMSVVMGAAELNLKGMLDSEESWEKIDQLKQIFWNRNTKISEWVSEHWKEDDFYGSQFLNGINPNMIKRCSSLPPNLPVREEMVKAFLEEGSSLDNEIKKGNIFLYDQKILSGIPGRMYNGVSLQVSAGLCLLYLNPEKKLKPIAIQLQQQPSEENPIFLPSDSETDWLLAKMFIKQADILYHQAGCHFKDTHFLSESWYTSLIRNFPVIHPIYKFDYQAFIPNGAILLRKPPPTVKGQSSMKTILETLPNIGESVKIANLVYVLTKKYSDFVALGSYPEELFQDPEIQQMVREFQAHLSKLSEDINARNAQLEVPYEYLNPNRVENAITQKIGISFRTTCFSLTMKHVRRIYNIGHFIKLDNNIM